MKESESIEEQLESQLNARLQWIREGCPEHSIDELKRALESFPHESHLYEVYLKSFEKEYGSLSSLNQKVLISKCTSPEKMSDYVLWKYLSQNAEFHDNIVVEDTSVFEVLSPRRAELLEYLMNNDIPSIKNLADSLKRNYKNVYDDLQALAKYDLVELAESGRSLKPCSVVTNIEISFEG